MASAGFVKVKLKDVTPIKEFLQDHLKEVGDGEFRYIDRLTDGAVAEQLRSTIPYVRSSHIETVRRAYFGRIYRKPQLEMKLNQPEEKSAKLQAALLRIDALEKRLAFLETELGCGYQENNNG